MKKIVATKVSQRFGTFFSALKDATLERLVSDPATCTTLGNALHDTSFETHVDDGMRMAISQLKYDLKVSELVREMKNGHAVEIVDTAPESPKLVARIKKLSVLSETEGPKPKAPTFGFTKRFNVEDPSVCSNEAYLTTAVAVALGIDNIPWSCPMVKPDGTFQVGKDEILQTSVPGRTALQISESSNANIFDVLNKANRADIQKMLLFLMVINAYDNHGDNVLIHGDKVGVVDFEGGFLAHGVSRDFDAHRSGAGEATFITFDSVLMGTEAFSGAIEPDVLTWAMRYLRADYFESACQHIQLPVVGSPVSRMPHDQYTAMLNRAEALYSNLKDGATIKEAANSIYPVSVALIDALTNRYGGELTHDGYVVRNESLQGVVNLRGFDPADKALILEMVQSAKEKGAVSTRMLLSSSEDETDSEATVPPLRLPAQKVTISPSSAFEADLLDQLDAALNAATTTSFDDLGFDIEEGGSDGEEDGSDSSVSSYSTSSSRSSSSDSESDSEDEGRGKFWR